MPAKENKSERLAKRIAGAGLCSRRVAERWIEDGRVDVNSELITTPAFTVTDEDIVCVDGTPLPRTDPMPQIFVFHKPAGYICTEYDPENRPTIFDILPNNLPRVMLVGRLDLNTEGLLLLTTNGALAQKLMLPATGLKRTYKVRVLGQPQPEQLDKLRKGITVDGVRYRPMDITMAEGKRDGANQWVNITLTEGKNREIRIATEFVGLRVNRLIRLSYGPFKLGDLPRQAVAQIPFNQVKKLMEDIGFEM